MLFLNYSLTSHCLISILPFKSRVSFLALFHSYPCLFSLLFFQSRLKPAISVWFKYRCLCELVVISQIKCCTWMVCTCVLVFIFESLLMWLYVCGSKGLYVYLSVGHSVFPCLSMCVCVCVSVSSYENVYVRFAYVWTCLLGFSMCLCQVCGRPCVRLGCHRTQTIIHPC